MTPSCLGQGILNVLPGVLFGQLCVLLVRGSHPAIDHHVGHLARDPEIKVVEEKVELPLCKDFVETIKVLRHECKAFSDASVALATLQASVRDSDTLAPSRRCASSMKSSFVPAE